MEKTSQPLLQVRGLTVAYGNIVALRDVELTVGAGEIVTLVGANGAGKSTLFKAIMGIQRARQGEILYAGKDIAKAPTDRIVAGGISIVPEGRGIVAQLSVQENLDLGGYHGLKRDAKAAFRRVFDWFPILEERKNQLGGTLSGGQQQMLALARAMLAEPALILMDEPSLGLAPIVVNGLFEIIAKLNREEGQAILLSEQNAKKALAVAQRGYVFERGRVALSGTSQELGQSPAVRKAYLGG